jgi:hypothetical protein
MTALIAIAGLAVLSPTVFGQQMRQTPYAMPPEPAGRYNVAGVQHLTAATAYAADPRVQPTLPPPPQPQLQSNVSHQLASSVGVANNGCNGASGCSSCSSAGCSDCACSSCDHCCASKCCYGCCLHRTGVFGEFLYLSPRNIDLAYAVPQDGIGGIGTVPIGEVGVLDHDYSPGFRAGFNLAVDCCSSFSAAFTWYETDTEDFISVGAPNVIQPLVMFPGTFNAGFTAQEATASYSLDYQLVDLDYRAILLSGNRYHVNYTAGLRYAHMDQNFNSVFPFATPDGTTTVSSEINFDGFGIRLGLEGERRIFANSGLSLYSKTAVSALAGEMRSSYEQANQFNGVEATTAWDDDRVVSICELELGLAWISCSGCVRLSAGYYFAVWNNMVTTPEYINAVQNGTYHDVSQDAEDTIAFDGLVTRLEFSF